MKLSLIALVSLLLMACAPKSQDGCGFVQNVYGERISHNGPITFKINKSVPVEFNAAILAAAKQWNEALGEEIIIISKEIETKTDTQEKNGENIIYYFTSWESHKFTEQARSSVYWIGAEIQEVDVRINGKNFVYSIGQGNDKVDLISLMVHEFGHALGLNHNDKKESTMQSYLANGTTRSIGEIDKQNLQCQYAHPFKSVAKK